MKVNLLTEFQKKCQKKIQKKQMNKLRLSINKTALKFKKAYEKMQFKLFLFYGTMLSGLSLLPIKIFADSNPWGGSGGIDPSSLQKNISTDATSTLKTASIVIGTFLLLAGVTVLYKSLSRDADERKAHGNTVTIILVAGLCCVVGLTLLGIAWKGLSATT